MLYQHPLIVSASGWITHDLIYPILHSAVCGNKLFGFAVPVASAKVAGNNVSVNLPPDFSQFEVNLWVRLLLNGKTTINLCLSYPHTFCRSERTYTESRVFHHRPRVIPSSFRAISSCFEELYPVIRTRESWDGVVTWNSHVLFHQPLLTETWVLIP